MRLAEYHMNRLEYNKKSVLRSYSIAEK